MGLNFVMCEQSFRLVGNPPEPVLNGHLWKDVPVRGKFWLSNRIVLSFNLIVEEWCKEMTVFKAGSDILNWILLIML